MTHTKGVEMALSFAAKACEMRVARGSDAGTCCKAIRYGYPIENGFVLRDIDISRNCRVNTVAHNAKKLSGGGDTSECVGKEFGTCGFVGVG